MSELEHVLERAAILAGDAPVLTSQEIDFGTGGELTGDFFLIESEIAPGLGTLKGGG